MPMTPPPISPHARTQLAPPPPPRTTPDRCPRAPKATRPPPPPPGNPPRRAAAPEPPPPPAPAAVDETIAADSDGAETAPTRSRGSLARALGDRYTIARRLNSGGQGVVYQVWDRREQRMTALKVCSGLSVSDHHRLKQEYRAAKALRHRNIARVFDLIEDRGRGLAYFSMELIRGVDFVAHVRQATPTREGRLDLPRLRRAVRQLASGLAAIHATGHAHRDIKPSNVLVADDGRVVILDFGLVSRTSRGEATLSARGLAGTPCYMAPEQLTEAGHGDPAIDCYALGVVLYEAITGQVPLDLGSFASLLAAKHFARPRPPSALAPGIPVDLEALVLGLLERDPERRRTVADVLAWCGDGDTPPSTADDRRPAPAPCPDSLHARREPLRRLFEAMQRLRDRQSGLVVVKGPAGAGKSALVRHFVDRVRALPQVLLLEGRCDDHESVPFRAFDRIMEDLARLLLAAADGPRARLLAGGTAELAALFPILTQVPEIGRREGGVRPLADPRRAFAELRALLGRLAGERTLVLVIANLHRSDRDSLDLLRALLVGDEAVPMLVLATVRGESGEATAIERAGLDAVAEVIEVAMLPAEDTVAYARERLVAAGLDDVRLARALALACRGDTRLLARLAPQVAARPPTLGIDDAPLDLLELMRPTLCDASPAARRLLDLLALAGAPIAFALLERASGASEGLRPALRELLDQGLVDVDEAALGGEERVVRCVSSAVSTALAAGIPDARRTELHRDLARAYQACADADDERCFDHLLAAGEIALARDHAAEAGMMAQRVGDFDQAIRFFGLAVACDPDSGALRGRLADALASAGDFERAADERLRAARGVGGRRAIETALLACDHLFLAGSCARGQRAAALILHELAIDIPAADAEVERILAREIECLRGLSLEFRAQLRSQIGGDLLLRIDAALTIGRHLRDVDPPRAALLLIRACLWALVAGETDRIARALAWTATVLVGRDRTLANRLLARADAIALRARDPAAAGLVALSRGLVRLHEVDPIAALADLTEAEGLLGARAGIAPWERRMLVLGRLAAQDALGEVGKLATMIKELAADPTAMRDGTLRRWLAIYDGVVLVARGDALGAELRHCAAYRALDGHDPRLVLALTVRLAVLSGLYLGVPRKALRRLQRPDGTRAWASTGDDPRLACHHWAVLDGRVALACAALRTRDFDRCCAATEQAIAALEAMGDAPALTGEAALLRAGLAYLRGDRPQALRLLRAAERDFRNAGMSTAGAATQLRISQLSDDPADVDRRARAERWLHSEGILAPDRWAAAHAPGFDDPARLVPVSATGVLRPSTGPQRAYEA